MPSSELAKIKHLAQEFREAEPLQAKALASEIASLAKSHESRLAAVSAAMEEQAEMFSDSIEGLMEAADSERMASMAGLEALESIVSQFGESAREVLVGLEPIASSYHDILNRHRDLATAQAVQAAEYQALIRQQAEAASSLLAPFHQLEEVAQLLVAAADYVAAVGEVETRTTEADHVDESEGSRTQSVRGAPNAGDRPNG